MGVSVPVPRTVTWFERDRSPVRGKTLSDFKDEPFYVLLGEPGAGKTTAFKQEADIDTDGLYVPARDFVDYVRYDATPNSEWQGKTLFIDGLDEVRAGSRDLREEALNRIRVGLHRLGGPHARLSCRSAAWLATNDREAINRQYEHPKILRLDPLTEQDARTILGNILGHEADSFLAEARMRSLHGLLENPLSLDLLTKAVEPGKWPDSRVDTFKKACLAMLTEANPEHAAASRHNPVREQDAFAAAGRMAALLLLTGKDGIAWDRTDVSEPERFLLISDVIDSVAEPSPEGMRRALGSRLFVSQAPGRFAPVHPDVAEPMHPHVAEYLAARHLARAVDEGVVLARVLALLTSGGEVTSTLRGVAAWLAALCPEARRTLMDIDPMGVAAYGDASAFDDGERSHLLLRLTKTDGLEHRPPYLAGPGLGGLVSPQTMADLREYMDGHDRSETADKAMLLLLQGIAAAPSRCGDSISGKHLLAIARDATWSPLVRALAVEAEAQLPADERRIAQRLRLLQEVKEGSVEDPGGNVRTSLFGALYPHHIRPEDALSWIPVPVPYDLAAVLLNQSSLDQCRALLDALRTKHADHFPDPSLADLTWKLLAQALETHGETLGVTMLYDWTELAAHGPTGWDDRRDDESLDRALQEVLGDPGEPAVFQSGAPRVQKWLAQRPSIQKDLLLEFFGQDRLERKSGLEVADEALGFWQFISFADRPDDFHAWCLKQALSMSADAEKAACCLIGWAVEPIRRSATADEWLETGLEWVGDDIVLAEQLEAIAEHDRDLRRNKLAYATRRPRDKTSLVNQVMEHRDGLLTGAGPERLIVSLGQAYWDRPIYSQSRTGEERLCEVLAPWQDAAEVALQALSTVPTADVGPSIAEIARMDSTGKDPSWGRPYLAGLDVIDRRGGNVLEIIGENLNRALWFYFATPLDCEMPPWFDKVLRARPDKVANVIVDLHRHRIRSKLDNASTLSAMADDDRYCEATKMALPDLLRAFPAKGYGAQLEMLRHVLALAVRHMPDKVVARVWDRMKIRRMNAAQRATWLGAGIAVDSSEFLLVAVTFLKGGRASRARHLIDALQAAWKARQGPLLNPGSPAPAVGAMVRVLGAKNPPLWDGQEIGAPASALTLDMGSKLVKHLVDCLAGNPTYDASVQLESLSRDRELADWHNTIRSALERQRILHHDAEYTVPSVEHVQQVLAGGPPASPADLVALVVDQLERLGNDIRHGSTDDWQQYWNEEVRKGGRVTPPRPKRENSCRNALLSALNRRLPPGVDARREGSYAENTSADVRVRYGSFGIPIEVKKSNHRELWSAMRNQLMAKYTRDPESAWHGVYVVLWFGANGPEPVKTPPTGPRPKDPGELPRRLEEDLSPAERSRVKVVVIDVSWPDVSSSGASRPSRAGRRQEFRSPRT